MFNIYLLSMTLLFQQVNYKGISTSSDFDVYKKKTKELQRVQVTTASREEKLAFFINIYNALVIHGNVVLGPPKGLWQRYKVGRVHIVIAIKRKTENTTLSEQFLNPVKKYRNRSRIDTLKGVPYTTGR